MNKLTLIALLGLLSVTAFGQGLAVRIKARGDDVRKVVSDIFEQTNQQFVFESSARQSLYMSLDGVTLEYALETISDVADLTFEKKGTVWHVRSKRAVAKPISIGASAPNAESKMMPLEPNKPVAQKFFKVPAKVKAIANIGVLDKKVSTKLTRTALSDVFAKFGEQTGVKFVIDKSVPEYKIDAFFYNTSLKFSLERICKAANLKFSITDGKTVRISKA